ncbi:MAG TPA: PEP-CTERM sorting domain-containing protein, partial [Gemmatales bacterium]|nr:PEP-CTERM sorting domain-containing protein [Gemmatales bacterium]
TINRDVNLAASATLAPGSSPGILTVTGNVVFATGSTFAVELNGLTAGSDYDRLALGSSSSLSLNDAFLDVSVGFTPNVGDRFFIVTGLTSPVSGIFNGLPEASTLTANGNLFQIFYTGDAANDLISGAGNDIVLVAVPEPATIFMIGGVALGAGVGVWRYRRRLQNLCDQKIRV